MRGYASVRKTMAGALFAGGMLLAGMVPQAVSAQEMDARWLPWIGCWEAAEAAEESPMLCVRPDRAGEGVEFVTWAGDEVISTEIIRADGVARQATREGCRGVEEARFSRDGKRVYLRSSYTCEDGGEQSATGILAMMNPMEWADIKVVGAGGERTPWALRYRLARSGKVSAAGMENLVAPRAMAVKEARILASGPLTVDDVLDAAESVDPEGVETLIMEKGDPFDVDSETLLALADAGVAQGVIDLVVAVSFPERFAVRAGAVREVPREPGQNVRPGVYGRPMGWGFFNPFFYDSFYSGYGYYPYGGYGYGWSSGYYYRPTTVIVEPVTSGSGSARMVKGRGYTRGGSPSSSGPGTVGSGSRSGSGGGAVRSSGGGSSGGSSSGSGRRAVRRGGGGGGI